MSIEKLDFNYVRQEHKSFTTLYNEVIQNINNPFYLGVYCYLSSLPHDWTVSKKQLMNHFKSGRDKIESTMSWLRSNFLLEYHQGRNPDNTFCKNFIIIKDGREFIEKVVNNQQSKSENPAILKTSVADPFPGTLISRYPESPLSGESAPTYINIKDTYKTKEHKINKSQSKKQIASVDLPEWLDKSLWEEFVQFRKEMKKPMTELIQKKTVTRLDKMRSEGQNVEDVLNQSMANGWQGIFEVKSNKGNNYGNQQQRTKSVAEIVWERSTAGLPEFENYRSGQEILPF